MRVTFKLEPQFDGYVVSKLTLKLPFEPRFRMFIINIYYKKASTHALLHKKVVVLGFLDYIAAKF